MQIRNNYPWHIDAYYVNVSRLEMCQYTGKGITTASLIVYIYSSKGKNQYITCLKIREEGGR
jgi:hypothetical protein